MHRAFEALGRERKSLMVVSILQKNPNGLTAKQIADKINQSTGDNLRPEEITRLIREEINEWARNINDNRKIIIGFPDDIDRRVAKYTLDGRLREADWENLTRVAFSILLLRYGKTAIINELTRRDNGLSLLMDILYGINAKKVIEVQTNYETIQFCPYRVGFNGGWYIYGWEAGEYVMCKISFNRIEKVLITDVKFDDNQNVVDEIEDELKKF